MALAIAPIMIAGYFLGLQFGPLGVALAYSVVMMLWIVPAIAWAVHGTNLSVGEVLVTVSRPLAAGVIAGAVAFGVGLACGDLLPLARLSIQTLVLFAVYAALPFFATGQRALYVDILRGLKR